MESNQKTGGYPQVRYVTRPEPEPVIQIDQNNPFSSRKFILGTVILGMMFGLTVSGKLEVNKFIEFATILYGSYGVMNITDRLTSKNQ